MAIVIALLSVVIAFYAYTIYQQFKQTTPVADVDETQDDLSEPTAVETVPLPERQPEQHAVAIEEMKNTLSDESSAREENAARIEAFSADVNSEESVEATDHQARIEAMRNSINN